MTRDQLQRILAEFRHVRVLVVGDFCLDRWCTYNPDLGLPSRETGIPRTAVVSYEVTPGAGGTVTNNLRELGAGRVEIVAVAGDDANGFELERALRQRGVGAEHLIRAPGRQTFTYTKLLNRKSGQEDLPRLDFVNTAPPSPAVEQAMIAAIAAAVPAADVVIVADQSEIPAGAVITGAVREALLEAAARFPQKIFIVDSRAQIEQFRGFIVKPNEDEALEAARRIRTAADVRDVETAGQVLREHLNEAGPKSKVQGPKSGRETSPTSQVSGPRSKSALPLYVTRGAEGALLFEGEDFDVAPRVIPAYRDEHPVDICGAGDAFEAGLALALAATQRLSGQPDYGAAAEVGHLVAAVTITKKGTGTASPAEVLAHFESQMKSSKFQVPSSKLEVADGEDTKI